MDTPASEHGSWRIGEIARMLGVSEKTLRHYERVGLLRPPLRTAHRYRVYDDDDMRRARHVIGLRGLGLSLEEIRCLLNDDKGGPTRRQLLLGLLDEHLRDIDEMLAVLQGKRDDMAARYLALLDVPGDVNEDCICAALVACNCQNTCQCCDQSEGSTVSELLRASSQLFAR